MPLLDELLFLLTLFAALGCGVMAGLFFAFSNFVMKALARLHPESGIAAMQSINVAVLNPLFLSLFLGTAAACLLLVIYSLTRWQSSGTLCIVAGSGLYLLGNFVVTIACNVPRNDALARVDASNSETVGTWRDYVLSWTRWNHVRTITALAAAALLTIALCQLRTVG
ncbi:DUF1772 domain-containing protein [Pseudomonas cavernicola]|uniref:DUF1772 domain-containing protein n=1 Tax=Pseudomonas cavernicola TaxID=2320866 RepID=A0A418XC79_9PSED|nr:anthrone oxygenase family protein [Pseudomonas cavernicola]RJG10112.1 DUF1772 domain-containing protein [Pseudomonas cavernicola]